jgi:galactonate dehydratase
MLERARRRRPLRIVEITTHRTALQPNVCILGVRTDTGLSGLGEAFWGSPEIEAYLHETAAPIIATLEDSSPSAVATALRPYVGFSGSGAEVRGNGAIDIALWDILGKSAGLPVSRLLGGPVSPTMRVYNTCAGYAYNGREGRQATTNWGLPGAPADRPYEDLDGFLNRPAELARSLRDEGYTAMKIWPFDMAFDEAPVGSRGRDISTAQLRTSMKSIEAIRGAVGDEMDILVELHSLWSLRAATKIVTALADISPFWVEDPVRNDAFDDYRRLHDVSAVPIAAGEALGGHRAFKPMFELGAIDVAIVDPGWSGGITEMVKIANMADAFGISFAPHDCTGPISFAVCTQVVGSQPNGLIAETVRAYQASWYPEVVDGLPPVVRGSVALSTAPGLGLTLRPSFVARSDTRTRTTRIAG